MASTAAPFGGIRRRSKARGAPHLVDLEFRRGATMWLITVGLVALYFALRDQLSTPIAIWPEEVVSLRDAVAFLGPLFAGAAAWMASRDHRRGANELLGTTPLPAAARRVSTWAGSAIAAAMTYAVLVIPVMVVTSTRATWGGPEWWPVIVGLTAMIAHTALGFAFGTWFPSRFIAPVLAALLFLGQIYVGTVAGNGLTILTIVAQLDNLFGEWRYLSPIAETSRDVSYGIWPAVGMWQALWFLGGAGVMLSLAAMRPRPTPGAGLALVASLAVSLGGATAVVQRTSTDPFSSAFDDHMMANPAAAWEPACAGSQIAVCVHPAYEPWLDELATRVDRVVAPIAGRPGVPTTILQDDPTSSFGMAAGTPPQETVRIWLHSDADWVLDNAVISTAYAIIQPNVFTSAGPVGPEQGLVAQEVISRWLLAQAGDATVQVGFTHGGHPDQIAPYVSRFAALPPSAQQAWFDAHFADLLAGRLTLADLP
ncbi:MAG: hypothetical protein WKF80_10830 [Thermomicrobiales bacterium]